MHVHIIDAGNITNTPTKLNLIIAVISLIFLLKINIKVKHTAYLIIIGISLNDSKVPARVAVYGICLLYIYIRKKLILMEQFHQLRLICLIKIQLS